MNRFACVVALVLLSSFPALGAMTKAQAKKYLADQQRPETADGMLSVLNTSNPEAPRIVEAYLALGIPADRPITYQTDDGRTLTRYPLNYMLDFACSDDTTVAMTKLLVNAGADPNTTNPDNDWSALSQAYGCPDVIRVLLAAPKKPDVNRVDKQGNTVMHYVVEIGGERQRESIQMLLDAGFDLKRFRSRLVEDARGNPEVQALLGIKPDAPRAKSASAPAPAKTSVDWKALPPYPERSEAQAKNLLYVPGGANSINDEMWDGIVSREPARLALALRAGADVHQKRAATGYTPLILLAERCDLKDEEIQTANAEQLIAAGADLTSVDANGANALTMAAHSCPIGVVRALIAAGLPLQARDSQGTTPLKNAIMSGRADVVDLLLDAGVDPKKEGYNLRALASGNSEVEAALKKKRAKH